MSTTKETADKTPRAKSRAGKSTYHHGNLREALVDAALALVDEKGPQGLTLRAAARRAGVSQAAPYRHFQDKESLLAAVAERGFRNMAKFMGDACAPYENDPPRRFSELGVAYVLFAVRHPHQFHVMFGPDVADKKKHQDLHRAAQETFSLLAQSLSDIAAGGKAPPGARPGKESSLAAWSIVHGLSSLIVDGQLEPLGIKKKDIEQVVRNVLGADVELRKKLAASL